MTDYLTSRSHAVIRHWPVTVLRVYTGLFFAYHGLGKLRRDDFADAMAGFLNSTLESSFAFYRPFTENVVLPNPGIFAGLVAWGEFLAGVALVLGLATRYAAGAAALMVANFWFAKGQELFAGQNHDVVWLVILLVLALIPAGRIHGLDDGLSDRLPFLR